jgi:molecular chaperone GrpE
VIDKSGFERIGGAEDQADGSGGDGESNANPAESAVIGGSGLPVESAESAVGRLAGELDEARDRHLRLAAEYDNFRKRTARERAELVDRAQAGLAGRLLDALDDLDRVVNGVDQAAEPGVVHQALVLIDRKLRKELEAAGLERLDPVGQTFDPAVAEAVHILPPPSPDKDHTVAATFQVGYRFKGSLIRPARVQVFSSEGHA